MTWRSNVCANAILTAPPKRSMPKLAGLGAASSVSGVSSPTTGISGQICGPGARRVIHCSGSVAVFDRSAVAGITCTILNPRALSSLRISGRARAVRGWISCSSKMPLPRASMRRMARRATSRLLMRIQSSARKSTLQVMSPCAARYCSTEFWRRRPGMRKNGATASGSPSASRSDAKPSSISRDA